MCFNAQALMNKSWFWGRSAHLRNKFANYRKIESFPEKETAARQSSATETTQLSWSNELCKKLGKERNDETGDLIGATPLTGGLVRCWHVPLARGNNRMRPISHLPFYFLTKIAESSCKKLNINSSVIKRLKNISAEVKLGAVAQGESTTLKT